MGSAANGMAAHGGVIPFTATFLVFADYMRPPIRLAALETSRSSSSSRTTASPSARMARRTSRSSS